MHDTVCHAWSNAHEDPILTPSITDEDTRENKDMQGIDVTQVEHGVRRQLWILVRSWTNECVRNRSVDRQVTVRVRLYVTFQSIF